MAELISAGEFATEGERCAAGTLRDLPARWIVICNKMLVTASGRSYETDFIVVGNNWVFLLDEKSWQGKIYGGDQQWVRADGSAERSPLNKVDYVAGLLADHLRYQVGVLRDVTERFVRGGVLLSRAAERPQIRDPRAADSIFLRNTVCEHLVALDREDGNPAVAQARDKIRTCLVDLRDRPKAPKSIDLYTIDEVRPGRPGCRVFGATLPGAGPRVLMVYDLSREPTAAAELRSLHLREFKALQRLRSTGLVPEVGDPFTWSDDSLVLPVSPLPGRALGAYPAPATRDELIDDIGLAAAAFRGLERLHEQDVIHRAIGPDAVYVIEDGKSRRVAFTNFHAARVPDASIAARLDALQIEDPYAAPELAASYGFATPEADTYSLALVFLERWSGETVAAMRAPGGAIIVPDLQACWPFLDQRSGEALTHLLRTAVSPGPMAPAGDPAARRLSAKEIAECLSDIALRLHGGPREGDVLDNRYRIRRLLGQGTSARTYLVTDTQFGGEFAVKQFLRPAAVIEQAGREFVALQHLSDRHLPRVYDLYPPENDIHVKMDYIPGPTLESLTGEFPWPLDVWWPFARGLLDGIAALEDNGLLHRDIKPANIILHEDDDRPVLVDFGFAVPWGVADDVAGTPVYFPPEAWSSAQPPLSSDRYAAAVLLFQALIGRLPFEIVDGCVDHSKPAVVEMADETVQRLAAVLRRAVSVDPSERPATVQELRVRLQAALAAGDAGGHAELADQINSWVDNIRRLYRNSDIGNGDNRGLDSDFARLTYVPTALDERLLPLLFAQRPKAVFLCGNPGDGKTAFLEQVRSELERRGAAVVMPDASGWESSYQGHLFRSCYDASEASQGLSADAQLTAKLAGLEGDGKPVADVTVLVAINDGRLADFFARNQDHFGWLAEEVARRSGRLDRRDVWVVDLKRRAFVNAPGRTSPSVFRRVLERLVAPQRWEICRECAAQDVCPILSNARALNCDLIRDRLEHVLLLSHLRQQHHTTMRDLRSALAYLITGNASCEQVHVARQGAARADDDTAPTLSLVDLAYWRSAFAPLDTADDLLADLAELDPARFPQPRLDRFLYFHRALADSAERAGLFYDGVDLSPQHFADENAWRAVVKRRLYFESIEPAPRDDGQTAGATPVPVMPWASLLPYRHAAEFLDLLAGRGDLNRARERLALGLSRSDGLAGPVLQGYLSVKVDISEEQQLVVLKQFPVDQFTVTVERPHRADVIETIAESMVFAHMSGTPRLEITLDLFELLMRMADGLQPGAPEFVPLLEDLVPFKGALLRQETCDLVLLESQRRVHRITQQDGTIVRRARYDAAREDGVGDHAKRITTGTSSGRNRITMTR